MQLAILVMELLLHPEAKQTEGENVPVSAINSFPSDL